MERRESLNKAVIEIEEVEYLINEKADKDIQEKKEFITLIRLVDG